MKKEKMNDKGFSLVELIIVIAIMAVLVVVLAPQYLKYVERSRNATDTTNATSMVTALQVWAADPNAGEGSTKAFAKDDEIEITVDKDKAALTKDTNGAASSALTQAAITDLTSIKCKSKTKWDTYIIYGKVQADGNIKFTYSSKLNGSDPATDEFAAAMK